MKKGFVFLLTVVLIGCCVFVAMLQKRITKLETTLQPLIKQAQREQAVSDNRAQARLRMQKDREIYSKEQLSEIESLYQVANKKWGTEEASNSLDEMLEKYSNANRTGCANLYLGQMTKGDEQLEFLNKAINEYSDCYYGDGVQVGAYARYYLACRYARDGKKEDAKKLFNEIETEYPNAIDHKGNMLSEKIESARKEFFTQRPDCQTGCKKDS